MAGSSQSYDGVYQNFSGYHSIDITGSNSLPSIQSMNTRSIKSGVVAQLGECSVRNAEVVGSIPIGSTLKSTFPVRYWPG